MGLERRFYPNWRKRVKTFFAFLSFFSRLQSPGDIFAPDNLGEMRPAFRHSPAKDSRAIIVSRSARSAVRGAKANAAPLAWRRVDRTGYLFLYRRAGESQKLTVT